MNSPDDQQPAEIAKSRGTVFLGPIEIRHQVTDVHLVTFLGPSEAMLLKAAGTWLADHPTTLLISLNWHDPLLGPRSNRHLLPPKYRLDLTVRPLNAN